MDIYLSNRNKLDSFEYTVRNNNMFYHKLFVAIIEERSLIEIIYQECNINENLNLLKDIFFD